MAHTVRFEVPPADDGVRLDQALARHVPGLSRRRARVLVDIGGVFVDRARVKVASRAVRAGQVIEATLGGALDRAAAGPGGAPAAPAYRVVHEDPHLIVVDKPPGLVTAPTPESDRGDLLDLLARRPGAGRVYLVHRIDRPTSGLLVFARSELANRVLAERFAAHDVERAYRAVLVGAVPPAPFTLDRPIRGQRAVTHVVATRALADRAATLATIRLETGRSHQIRIHLAGIGHPVAGDRQHGGEVVRRLAPGPPRLALHAALLGLVHPATGEAVRWTSPWPPDLTPWLIGLGADPADLQEPS